MPKFSIELDGYKEALASVSSDASAKVQRAARFAVNDTLRWALSNVKRDINSKVAFPKGYLDREDRLSVGKFASDANLEGSLFSRADPTSLARFAIDAGSKHGVMVNVKVGSRPKLIRGAFISGLRGEKDAAGNVQNTNRSLIVRSKGKPNKAYRPKPMGGKWPDLWLLYGPSVYQVFRQSIPDYEPEIQSRLRDRFIHHMTRLGVL